MRSSLLPPPVERARPLLGTVVSVRAHLVDRDAAHAAIDAAFAEVELVHRLMSFHKPDSDVSRLNREAFIGPAPADPRTFEVLRFAQALAGASEGGFDITTGALAVQAGALPRPASPFEPDPRASWRDVELIEARGAVVFHRPLWVTLDGVAKGYAVDRAVRQLQAHGVEQGCVNAGGDLRLFGPEPEFVTLRASRGVHCGGVIELQDGALASSGGEPDRARAPGAHFHGRTRRAVRGCRLVSVAASTCTAADALTKVAMADGERAAPVLRRFEATAYLMDAGQSAWRAVAETA